MSARILIVGGTGQIGMAVARDLIMHTDARLTLGGRDPQRGHAAAGALGDRVDFTALDLTAHSVDSLAAAIRPYDLVLQCAGPFRLLPPTLLAAAIVARTDYVDICDDARATEIRLGLNQGAYDAEITAVIDTGTFPGIDNILVADALSRLPAAETVELAFVCAGSGDGGFGVLQTTFLAVSRPFRQRQNGEWVRVPSYRQRRVVDFGPEIGRRSVYAFAVPELWSLPHAFPQLQTCTSHFGTMPALWNWATRTLARLPESVRTDPQFLDDGAHFILPIVHLLDRWVGTALGISVTVTQPDGRSETAQVYAPSTGNAVGWATGIVAEMILDGTITATGVFSPETHVPPQPFLERLVERGGTVRRLPHP